MSWRSWLEELVKLFDATKTILALLVLALIIVTAVFAGRSCVRPCPDAVSCPTKDCPDCPACPVCPEACAGVTKDKFRLIIETNNYILTPLPTGELVQGKRGAYYLIDIKDAQQLSKRLQFDGGEYTIDRLQERFAISINAVVSEIFDKVRRHPNALFIRGSADLKANDTFKRNFDNNAQFRTVFRLNKVNGQKDVYEQPAVSESIPEPFSNVNLPNLRARFIQEVLEAPAYGLPAATILDGEVTPNPDEWQDRNVKIYLYVDWERDYCQRSNGVAAGDSLNH